MLKNTPHLIDIRSLGSVGQDVFFRVGLNECEQGQQGLLHGVQTRIAHPQNYIKLLFDALPPRFSYLLESYRQKKANRSGFPQDVLDE